MRNISGPDLKKDQKKPAAPVKEQPANKQEVTCLLEQYHPLGHYIAASFQPVKVDA